MAGVFRQLGRMLSGGPEAEDQALRIELAHALELNGRLERELARLRAVLRGTAGLNSALNYERVLDMTLDLAASAWAPTGGEAGGLVGALLLFDGEQLQMVSSRGLLQADLRVTVPGKHGLVEDALGSGQMRLSDQPENDPELGRLLAFRRCQRVVCLPLVVGLDVYGGLLFGHPNREALTEEGLELLDAIAQQAIVALQNAKLYSQLEQEKQRMIEMQEEARNKLARDLHDGPAQSIGAIAMRVNFARRLVTREPKSASDELYKIEELARRTSKEIRQMLFTLRPLILESEGLSAALQDLANKVQETHHQQVLVEADPKVEEQMEVGKQGVVFFIVEEAVNNARKHAKAEHIRIRLRKRGEMALLEIQDDGVGFDVQSVEEDYQRRGSLGMINLQERAEMVNGVLRIDSAPGRGTNVTVSIPLSVEAAERMHKQHFSA
jgi:signal transduction histidine kinase